MEWDDDVKKRNGAQRTKTCLSIRGEETNVTVGTEQQKVRHCTASPSCRAGCDAPLVEWQEPLCRAGTASR
jgi:hypothetical protein